jgi:hypothetical protein
VMPSLEKAWRLMVRAKCEVTSLPPHCCAAFLFYESCAI